MSVSRRVASTYSKVADFVSRESIIHVPYYPGMCQPVLFVLYPPLPWLCDSETKGRSGRERLLGLGEIDLVFWVSSVCRPYVLWFKPQPLQATVFANTWDNDGAYPSLCGVSGGKCGLECLSGKAKARHPDLIQVPA